MIDLLLNKIMHIDEIEIIEEDENDGTIYIKGIQPKTPISNVLEKIKTNGDIEVFDIKSNKVEDYTKYATSKMILRITKGEKFKEYTLVVRGDVNSDGNANFADILVMNRHRLYKVQLVGAYFRAGNVQEDKVVDFVDMLKVNKYRLEKISVL